MGEEISEVGFICDQCGAFCCEMKLPKRVWDQLFGYFEVKCEECSENKVI